MRYKFLILFLLITLPCISQVYSLKSGDKYWEDQLYLSVSYDIMRNQPSNAGSTGFSYSLSSGYIKDIPLNRKGSISVGAGLGYGFSLINHDLQVTNDNTVRLASSINGNKLRLHTIEFPMQLRWRTSDALTYLFWRIYGGVKINYNVSNSFRYVERNISFEFNNISIFNKLQTGLELSIGYGAFNLYVYHGLTPVYKNAFISNEKVNSKITKFGLIFYLL